MQFFLTISKQPVMVPIQYIYIYIYIRTRIRKPWTIYIYLPCRTYEHYMVKWWLASSWSWFHWCVRQARDIYRDGGYECRGGGGVGNSMWRHFHHEGGQRCMQTTQIPWCIKLDFCNQCFVSKITYSSWIIAMVVAPYTKWCYYIWLLYNEWSGI